jgi:hypothetical protein
LHWGGQNARVKPGALAASSRRKSSALYHQTAVCHMDTKGEITIDPFTVSQQDETE